MLENLQLIKDVISLILTALSIVMIVLTVIMKKSKNKKISALGEALEKQTSSIILVKNKVLEFMEEAEDFIEYSGNDKKVWVITKAKEFCINNGIKYDEKFLENTIEELITFSKKVNSLEKKVVIEIKEKKEGE